MWRGEGHSRPHPPMHMKIKKNSNGNSNWPQLSQEYSNIYAIWPSAIESERLQYSKKEYFQSGTLVPSKPDLASMAYTMRCTSSDTIDWPNNFEFQTHQQHVATIIWVSLHGLWQMWARNQKQQWPRNHRVALSRADLQRLPLCRSWDIFELVWYKQMQWSWAVKRWNDELEVKWHKIVNLCKLEDIQYIWPSV